MVTRLVPAIYERYWRPALGRRVFKGVTGPGMAEEMRIARLLLGLGEGDTVLDVACGPGNFTRELRARRRPGRARRSGSTPRATMLDRGGEELRRADPGNLVLIRGDATALPFARRDLRRAPAASPPCTCSPTRSPRSTRSAACSGPAAGSR